MSLTQWWLKGHAQQLKGEIFDARRISATRISAPKSLTVVVNTNFFLQS
jgi:hypothetical protein